MSGGIRAVELFCCAGGMAEGFRRAGIAFDLAFDRDADACDSYEANLGHRPVQVDAHDLVRLARSGMRIPGLDLLVADPPCTPWSRAGKRQGLDDPNDCLRVTVELITLWRPRAYLLGNIPGLDDSVNLPVIHEVFAPLREAGYCTADYRSLDAADYGVPQHRVRPFWFGHLSGSCLRWPLATHCDPVALATQPMFRGELRPWVTCAEALAHLPAEERGHTIARDDAWPWSRPATTVTADPRLAPPGHHGKSWLSPWPWGRPSTTLCARATLAPPGRNGRDGTSQDTAPGAVKLSERAATLLQGFPDTWKFCGKTKGSRWAQLGMAMPPPLAHAVATAIARWFCNQEASPCRA